MTDFFQQSCEGYDVISVDEAIERLEGVDEFALDFETTALYPNSGEIRVTSICHDTDHFIIDHYVGGKFQALLPHLKGKRLWVYNTKFETRWIDHHCRGWYYKDLIDICDIDFLAKAKLGGYASSFAYMCKRDLDVEVSKEEQNSDWSYPTLTQSQLDYAAFDSFMTWELYKYWNDELTDEQFDAALFVFNSAVRGTCECEDTGLYLHSDYHSDTLALWETKRDTFERYLRRYTPESAIKNLRSDKQIGDYLKGILDDKTRAAWPKTAKKKQMQFESKYLRSISRQFPYPFSRWLAALAGFKYYNKYISTYGENLLTSAALAGKVHSRFNIGQARTGRYSSSSHNLQNIPRKTVVRRAFYSPDIGEQLMCLADYKGIEIRVLAELTDDEELRNDVIYGDVHAASCAAIYGYELPYVMEVLKSEGEGKYSNIYPVIKEQRSKAKGFTFQLLYGAGASALSDVLRCSAEEAQEAINAWAKRYSNAYNYRNVQYDYMMNNRGFLPIWDGRTVLVPRDDRSLPVASNYGIQGAAASVMYRAVYRVHRQFHENDCPAWLAATVHDELLSYADTDVAEEAMELQCLGMEQAWLDIFPDTNTDNLTDYAIGDSWASKP